MTSRPEPPPPGGASAAARLLAPYLWPALGAAALGAAAVGTILERAGDPALPLDDAFIHLQFARRLAEGSFFEYVPGEGYTSGATAPLWPVVLAPFHLLGLRGLGLVWAAWGLGALALAALALETTRLARPLAGRFAALAAGAMTLGFGGHVWLAFSGMEAIPFAWVMVRTGREAADWLEGGDGVRGRRGALSFALLGGAAPLVRPEGAIAAAVAAVALLVAPPRGGVAEGRALPVRDRLPAALPVAGPFLLPGMNLLLTGDAASTTARAKWMLFHPVLGGEAFWPAVRANVVELATGLLDGGPYSALFLPVGAAPVLAAGLVATCVAGARRGPVRALVVVTLALGILIPCTYTTMLWNRLRYLWPFMAPFFVGVACLARELGVLVGRLVPGARPAPLLLAGSAVGVLAARLPLVLEDLAAAASAIDRQQVALARWAAEALPTGARLGVNDTGAIAYLSGRRTFDLVGLTTGGEARHWLGGPGARLEHYERELRARPSRLPTHLLVYPEWLDCPPLLGALLHEASVPGATILGGITMAAHEARWDLLGRADTPARPPAAATLSADLDVGDLDAEAEHGFEAAGALDVDCTCAVGPGIDGLPAAEGGRRERSLDRFRVRLRADQRAWLVARVAADEPLTLTVHVGGARVGELAIEPASAGWTEPSLPLATRLDGPTWLTVEAPSGRRFTSFHYWIYTEG